MNVMSSAEFYLIDQNSMISNIYKSDFMDFVINELLVRVNESLGIFIDNNIQIAADKLNFDNLKIIEVIKQLPESSPGGKPFIINTWKLDTVSLQLIHLNGNTFELGLQFRCIIGMISNKLNIITGQIKIENKPVKFKENPNKKVIRNPIKNIFDQSNELLKKSNFGGKTIDIGSRLIPNVPTPIKLNDNIESTKIIEPDIPRPMDSVLSEKPIDSCQATHSNLSIELTPLGEYTGGGDNQDSEILKQTISSLRELKSRECTKLETLKKIVENDTENYSNFCNDHGDKKRTLRKNMEKEKERKNKFDANKIAYYKMKKHILAGKLEESKISELFTDEYPIFKFMDQKNLLDNDDDYMVFLNIYNEMYPVYNNIDLAIDINESNDYIPHNINYLNDEEQKKYKDIKHKNKNLIDEFMLTPTECVSVANTKSYPPLEDILKKLDNDDEIENESIPDSNNINFESHIDTNRQESINVIENMLKSVLNTE